MRLIPGNTKVQIEIFKGVTIWDLLVGALDLIILALIVSSSLPYKMAFITVHILISALLLTRIDKEPNYMYLIYIMKHFGYKRRFNRLETGKELVKNGKKEAKEVAFNSVFGDKDEDQEEDLKEELVEENIETKAERKARLKAEKAERKADDKLLKSKKLSKEEEDAIWLKRANQSAAKKQERLNNKAKAVNSQSDKWEEMDKLSSFTKIEDGYIGFHDKYYGAVIEIPSVEFRFFSEFRRNNSIENGIGSILRFLRPEFGCNILKIERPINYDSYEELENEKVDALRKSYESGFLSEAEFKTRVTIIFDRITEIQKLINANKVVVPFYYIVLFESDKKQLDLQVSRALESLRLGEMTGRRLYGKDLALMLKYSNSLDFDESEIDKINPEDYAKWAMPQEVSFFPRVTVVDGIATHNFRVYSFPTTVSDAWLASVMTYPSTKVMVKVKPMDSSKAIKAIDKSLSELRATIMSAKTDSTAMEAQSHLQSLQILLDTLQSDNEILLNVNVYVTAYDYVYTENNPKLPTPENGSFRSRIADMKKIVKRTWSEAGYRLNNNEFNQASAYIGSQVSGYDPMASQGRGMPSNTVAATFPWVFPFVMDDKGVQIGTSDGVPVFVDFFQRNTERVNSNMVIIGKSGSGKSFATKAILSNLAADDAKIFVLDPEDEYTTLAANFHGKYINVATNQYGRLNPFHIITNLDDDMDVDASTGYSSHLQFLEEFFKQILPDCDRDSLEYLNTLVDRIYKRKGIDSETDLSTLKPEDYPIFDDLYDEILMEFQKTQNDYIKTMLRTLMNYISKFSEGGRNAVIWNGPSSITTQENFIVFNFQSLLSNRNSTIANAQMLLVLKYIDNEISKNRDYNEKYGLNRKIVVVIDEAHVFIDTKYPVALDFMFQLAKRIRKYNGMQIVITQNIKDFVGSEEIARKSTAIINASQYSFIFALSPNDMDDLCKLYEKAGGINESEQEQMVQAPRGQAFAIMSPISRSSFTIVAPDDTRTLFSKPNYINPYFVGDQGQEVWEDFLGASPRIREANLQARNKNKVHDDLDVAFEKLGIKFSEISVDEFNEAASDVAPSSGNAFVSFSEEEKPVGPVSINQIPNASATPIIVQQSNRTEEILAGLVDKLSTESIIDEIKKAVKAEVDTRIADGSIELQKATESVTTELAAKEETEEDTEFNIDDILGSLGDNESVDDESDESATLGSIFDFANLEDEDEEYGNDDIEDSDDDDSTFDIISFLSQEVEEAVENDTIVEDFINGTESVVEVTLEQLMAYNSKQFASKQA